MLNLFQHLSRSKDPDPDTSGQGEEWTNMDVIRIFK